MLKCIKSFYLHACKLYTDFLKYHLKYDELRMFCNLLVVILKIETVPEVKCTGGEMPTGRNARGRTAGDETLGAKCWKHNIRKPTNLTLFCNLLHLKLCSCD